MGAFIAANHVACQPAMIGPATLPVFLQYTAGGGDAVTALACYQLCVRQGAVIDPGLLLPNRQGGSMGGASEDASAPTPAILAPAMDVRPLVGGAPAGGSGEDRGDGRGTAEPGPSGVPSAAAAAAAAAAGPAAAAGLKPSGPGSPARVKISVGVRHWSDSSLSGNYQVGGGGDHAVGDQFAPGTRQPPQQYAPAAPLVCTASPLHPYVTQLHASS